MKTKSILVGAVVLGAFTMTSAKSFSTLGNGDDVRNNLTSHTVSSLAKSSTDLACGDKKASNKTKDGKCGDKKTAGKTKDGKCGDGKCGDKKTAGKTKDGKCGDGKCGDGKAKKTVKEAKKAPATK